MNVKEVQETLEINHDLEKVRDQINQLVQDASQVTDTSSVQPRTVVIGNRTLFDFLYLLEQTEIDPYGEFLILKIKYLKVDR